MIEPDHAVFIFSIFRFVKKGEQEVCFRKLLAWNLEISRK